MALDQISQTIDVMTSVVGRLRNYLQQQEAAAADQQPRTAGGNAVGPDSALDPRVAEALRHARSQPGRAPYRQRPSRTAAYPGRPDTRTPALPAIIQIAHGTGAAAAAEIRLCSLQTLLFP